MPIPRSYGRMKEKGHRKVLYCPHCGKVVNSIECRNPREVEQFKKDYAAGTFQEEAAQSIEHCEDIWRYNL